VIERSVGVLGGCACGVPREPCTACDPLGKLRPVLLTEVTLAATRAQPQCRGSLRLVLPFPFAHIVGRDLEHLANLGRAESLLTPLYPDCPLDFARIRRLVDDLIQQILHLTASSSRRPYSPPPTS